MIGQSRKPELGRKDSHDTFDDPDRSPNRLEHWSLLNVQLDIAGYVGTRPRGFVDGVGVDAVLAERVDQPLAAPPDGGLNLSTGNRSDHCPGAEQTQVGSLFIDKRNDLQGV